MRDRFGAADAKSTIPAFPHPDRRVDADCPTAREQHRARDHPGARRGPRRHTEPAHERLRRGARPADRAGRASLALRTQQVIGYESGIADTVDPLAGSYFVESLTNEVEQLARRYIETIDEMGGSVAAIEAHYLQDEIDSAAYEFARRVERGEKVVVGVNRFVEERDSTKAEVFPIDEAQQRAQVDGVRHLKDVARQRRQSAQRSTIWPRPRAARPICSIR